MFEDQAAATSAEVDALRAKVATLEAQLAAVTPWEIERAPNQDELNYVMAANGHWQWKYEERHVWRPFTADGRPLPKPSHIP